MVPLSNRTLTIAPFVVRVRCVSNNTQFQSAPIPICTHTQRPETHSTGHTENTLKSNSLFNTTRKVCRIEDRPTATVRHPLPTAPVQRVVHYLSVSRETLLAPIFRDKMLQPQTSTAIAIDDRVGIRSWGHFFCMRSTLFFHYGPRAEPEPSSSQIGRMFSIFSPHDPLSQAHGQNGSHSLYPCFQKMSCFFSTSTCSYLQSRS